MNEHPKTIEELSEIIKNSDDYRLSIKVIANAKFAAIDLSSDIIKVKVAQRAIEGKANKAIIELLSTVLKIPKSKIRIISGERSSNKVILFTKI